MFANRAVFGMIPAHDVERAKAWYHDKLGIEPMKITATVTHPSPDAYVLEAVLTAGDIRKRAVNQLRRSSACPSHQKPGDMTATVDVHGNLLVKVK